MEQTPLVWGRCVVQLRVVSFASPGPSLSTYSYIIATADHGDNNMRHQQFYKMDFYDGSSKVPLMIRGPGIPKGKLVYNATSLFDLFPTILDLARVPIPEDDIDAHSLLPFLELNTSSKRPYPDYSLSQFHGDTIHLSWFMLRQGAYKYVAYGSGKEVPPRLFNIEYDPDELHDLASSMPEKVAQMDQKLRSIIDYPAVSADVESYNKESFALWRASLTPDEYVKTMSGTTLRWHESWSYNSTGCFDAIEAWLKTPNDTFAWSPPFRPDN